MLQSVSNLYANGTFDWQVMGLDKLRMRWYERLRGSSIKQTVQTAARDWGFSRKSLSTFKSVQVIISHVHRSSLIDVHSPHDIDQNCSISWSTFHFFKDFDPFPGKHSNFCARPTGAASHTTGTASVPYLDALQKSSSGSFSFHATFSIPLLTL